MLLLVGRKKGKEKTLFDDILIPLSYFEIKLRFENIHPLAPDILQARLSQKIITPEEYSPLKKYSLLAQDILQATIVLLSAACK